MDPALEKLEKLLDNAILEKNRIGEREFKRFVPLFQISTTHDNTKNQSTAEHTRIDAVQEDKEKLAVEWKKRVSLYHEVRVVNDSTGEVVYTLPAARTRVPTLNELDPENGGEMMDALVNSMIRSTPVRNLAVPYIEAVSNIIENGIPKEEVAKRQARFDQLTSEVTGKSPNAKKTTEETGVPAGTTWS
jgi:hypothetical protein